MTYEKQKLDSMLKENKISEKDYQLLLNAMKTSDQTVFAWFINPFQKIAGWPALILGLLSIIFLSGTGVIAEVYYSSILDCLNAANLKPGPALPPTFWLLLTQNIVNWLALSTIFIVFAFLLKQKRLRLIDFFGTVAFSRYPYIVLSLFIALIWRIDPSIVDVNPIKAISEYHFSIPGLLIDFIWQFCYAWQITVYFFAFKISSGLNGTKLWAAFVCSLLLAAAISLPINESFMWS